MNWVVVFIVGPLVIGCLFVLWWLERNDSGGRM